MSETDIEASVQARRLKIRAASALIDQEGEDLANLRGEAALVLLGDLEDRYEGLREYVDSCIPLATAVAAERLAAEIGATKAIRNVALQRRHDAERAWQSAPLPNADNPEAIVRLYSILAAIASDYLDSLGSGSD